MEVERGQPVVASTGYSGVEHVRHDQPQSRVSACPIPGRGQRRSGREGSHDRGADIHTAASSSAAPTNDEITVLRWLGYVESDLSVTKLGRQRLAVDQRKQHSLRGEATS